MEISIELDGADLAFDVEPRVLLGQLLRDQAGLDAVSFNCETSTCGSCTMLLDGEPVKSCALLGVMADGACLTSAAGVRPGLEAAVVEALDGPDVLPCGECRHAMQVVAAGLVRQTPQPTREEIGRALSGTICRCTGYQSVIDAIELAVSRHVA